MKRATVVVVTIAALAASFIGGYFVGAERERVAWQPAVADAQAQKTLVGIQRDIQLLTLVREKKAIDWVNDLEVWTVVQLQQIDPSTYVKGYGADHIYPKTMEMVNAYRKRYPDTKLNPEKDPSIAKAFR